MNSCRIGDVNGEEVFQCGRAECDYCKFSPCDFLVDHSVKVISKLGMQFDSYDVINGVFEYHYWGNAFISVEVIDPIGNVISNTEYDIVCSEINSMTIDFHSRVLLPGRYIAYATSLIQMTIRECTNDEAKIEAKLEIV